MKPGSVLMCAPPCSTWVFLCLGGGVFEGRPWLRKETQEFLEHRTDMATTGGGHFDEVRPACEHPGHAPAVHAPWLLLMFTHVY